MFQSLLLFLAPAATAPQAIETSPPAVARRAAERPRPKGRVGGRVASLGFALRVIGDAIGFAVLFAGCWYLIALLAAVV
ncbi:MAG: hypothetical protein ACSLE2_18525 [Lysobacterales bacterium]